MPTFGWSQPITEWLICKEKHNRGSFVMFGEGRKRRRYRIASREFDKREQKYRHSLYPA